MSAATNAARCTVIVDRGSGRWSNPQPCGRPVERDGKCKLHLRVEERRAAKRDEWEAKQARGDQLQDEVDALSAALGIEVTAEYSWVASAYTGKFVVPGDWLREQARAALAAPSSVPASQGKEL